MILQEMSFFHKLVAFIQCDIIGITQCKASRYLEVPVWAFPLHQEDQFPTTAIINHYKFSRLKQHKFISLQFWRTEVLNQFPWTKIKVSADLCCFWTLQERIYFLAFPSLGSYLHSLAHDSFLHNSQWSTVFSIL